jgi:hypothetical protein
MPKEFNLSQWLEAIGCGEYTGAFRTHKIEAEMLTELTEGDLKELGVTALGDRKKILIELRQLTMTAIKQRATKAPPLATGTAGKWFGDHCLHPITAHLDEGAARVDINPAAKVAK